MKCITALLLGLTFPVLCPGAKAQDEIYKFVTIAGNAGYGSADGTNNASRFGALNHGHYLYPSGGPLGMAVDDGDNVYVTDTDNSTIRKLTPVGTKWVSSTIAGSPGSVGSADGTNSNARFNYPTGIAVDHAGNLYISDSANYTIRKLAPVGTNWVSTTIAGLVGSPGSADGTNSAARFGGFCSDVWPESFGCFGPSGMAVDDNSNVFVADSVNHAIRKLTPEGTNWVSSTIISMVAASSSGNVGADIWRLSHPYGLGADHAGNLYVADSGNQTIHKLTGSGMNWISTTIAGSLGNGGSDDGTNSAASFAGPNSIGMDKAGNVYVGDSGNNTIRKLTRVRTNWVSSTIAGLAGAGGDSADGTNHKARFNKPSGLALDSAGNVYVGDAGNNTIRKIAPIGVNWVATTIAGSAESEGSVDGANSDARFYNPSSVAVDKDGNVYVADFNNNGIRKLTRFGADWISSTIAGLRSAQGVAEGINYDGRFKGPQSVAVDFKGNVYVADRDNNTIHKLAPVGMSWVSSTIAGLKGSEGSADGSDSNARFRGPTGIAVDPAGNLFVADDLNHTIRKLTAVEGTWVSSTIAGLAGSQGSADGTNGGARFNNPYSVAADTSGNVYVADFANHTVRKLRPVGTDWVSSTIAGVAGSPGSVDGTNSAARFEGPMGLSVDSRGNVYVGDVYNSTIRKLTPVGSDWVSSTIGGVAANPGSADGLSSAAQFQYPYGTAVDSNGRIFVADLGNNTIREGFPVSEGPSRPLFLSVSQSNGSVRFTWSAKPGQTYRLQFTSDLRSTAWQSAEATTAAANGIASATDTVGLERQRFYRVLLLP
jgi:hypothetical protein